MTATRPQYESREFEISDLHRIALNARERTRHLSLDELRAVSVLPTAEIVGMTLTRETRPVAAVCATRATDARGPFWYMWCVFTDEILSDRRVMADLAALVPPVMAKRVHDEPLYALIESDDEPAKRYARRGGFYPTGDVWDDAGTSFELFAYRSTEH